MTMGAGAREVRLERLLGRKVCDPSGAVVGHLEELCAERRGEELVVVEYHTGRTGLLERLADITIGGWLVRLLRRGRHGGYVIHWDQLDLRDPERPRTTCPLHELRPREAAGGAHRHRSRRRRRREEAR
ncbi:MAG TPA: hypothetical protein VFS05_13625 [Gemmatimonadaceae bacterium]|nr:hypothetical protein [Gemmatimonadaceae bacterium]